MFEIGFPELVLIAIVGLLVIGPERLPETLRTLGLWLGRMRRSFTSIKAEIEKEIGMDEVKRQLHNEAILEEMKRIESEVKDTTDHARSSLNEGVKAAKGSDPGVETSVSDLLAAQSGTVPTIDERDHGDAAHEHADATDGRDHTDAADDRDHTDAAEDQDRTDAADDSEQPGRESVKGA